MASFDIGSSGTSTQSQPASFGPYYLHELINSGGMADIWLATNQAGQAFALRRLHDRLKFNLVAKRRFLRGCEILSQIHNHEYVIGYQEHGKINGGLYLLMEYVEASNLKLMYHRYDPLLAEHVSDIIIEMAVALEHVHDSGFMHLDFKPENILITRSGRIRLVDFDLAQPRPEKPKKMWRNPGTPAYMAPEQLQKLPIDHRADIFAYGVTIYELLTHKKPFPGDNAQEVLRKQLDRTAGLIAPRNQNPDIPLGVEKVILKCLERDPEKRYPFMSLLVHDLNTALTIPYPSN